jgi:hypothetical protein
MDLNSRLDAMAEGVMREYDFMLSSHVANFARITDTSTPTSPAARRLLEQKLHDATVNFISTASTALKNSTLILTNNALDAAKAKLDSEKRTHLDDMIQEEHHLMFSEIIGMQFRDSATVMKALHRIALQVGIQTMRGKSNVGALIQARRGKINDLKFLQADRSGRQWSSSVYVRTLARHFLLKVYVESFLFGRVSVGSDLAEVVYSDPGHDNHGLRFSISGETAGYPKYVDIQDEIYHPNSSASVGI